jgi:hypothetical protein
MKSFTRGSGNTLEDRRRPRVCFVPHFAYGAIAGGDSGHIGGVEKQTSLMARWLAKQGDQVSMLTWGEGQQTGSELDGVRVFKVCRQDAGIFFSGRSRKWQPGQPARMTCICSWLAVQTHQTKYDLQNTCGALQPALNVLVECISPGTVRMLPRSSRQVTSWFFPRVPMAKV